MSGLWLTLYALAGGLGVVRGAIAYQAGAHDAAFGWGMLAGVAAVATLVEIASLAQRAEVKRLAGALKRQADAVGAVADSLVSASALVAQAARDAGDIRDALHGGGQ